jgi:hypothetical protein
MIAWNWLAVDAWSASVNVATVTEPLEPSVTLMVVPDAVRARSPWQVNRSAMPVAEVPLGVVTVTSTVPADSAGATAKSEPPDSTWKLVAATLPKETAVAPVKFVPVMVTPTPPASGPLAGLRAVTEGATAAV